MGFASIGFPGPTLDSPLKPPLSAHTRVDHSPHPPGLPPSRLDASPMGLKDVDLLGRAQMSTGLLFDKTRADQHFQDFQATSLSPTSSASPATSPTSSSPSPTGSVRPSRRASHGAVAP